MNKLTIKNIFFGQTDAKNEFIEDSELERETFMKGFLLPEVISLDDFRLGKKFFITGLKGTGKTALMRYLSLYLENEWNANTHFFLFKEEIKDNSKSKLTKGSDWISLKSGKKSDQKDYELVWAWFIFRKIVEVCESRKIDLFYKDKKWDSFVTQVKAATLDEKEKSSLFPKITQANITIKTTPIEANISTEFNKKDINNNTTKVKFAEYVECTYKLFQELKPGKDNLYFFVDEIELSYGEKKQYQKDIWMIRDLITAIDALNRIARKNKYQLYFITGLRREVLDSTKSAGKEINKPVEDFGVNLIWQQSGTKKDHPLIGIIHKRLSAAEQMSLEPSERAKEDELWERYLPVKIGGIDSHEYILNKTWYRPRDIVRLLNIAKEQIPQDTKFSSAVFESINKDYSSKSWVEISEELQSKYSTDEIDGIKAIIRGIKCPFDYAEITQKADSAKEMYEMTNNLLSKYRLSDILNHLYKVGIIGNTGDLVRFAYRGDADLIIENQMKIHDALWNFLSVESKKKRK